MTEHRAPVVTDPHSHTELPPQREAIWTPRTALCLDDGEVTDMGALFYACAAFRERWHGDMSDDTYALLQEARELLGRLQFWCIALSEGMAP